MKVPTAYSTLAEWKKFYKPLEKKLGVRVIAFNPDIRVTSPDPSSTSGLEFCCDLPVWLAAKIIEAVPD